MTLFVHATNRSAIAFFEVLGFTQLTGKPLAEFVADDPDTTIENNFVFIDGSHNQAMYLAL